MSYHDLYSGKKSKMKYIRTPDDIWEPLNAEFNFSEVIEPSMEKIAS